MSVNAAYKRVGTIGDKLDKIPKLEKQIERLTKALKQSKSENKKLKKEVEMKTRWFDQCLNEKEKLEEENKELTQEVMTKFGFCHKCNRSLTEDDFAMGKGMCESCCCEEEEKEEEKKEEVKKEVCKMCGAEKLMECEIWFPVKNLDGTKSFLCGSCGLCQF
jgi:chromosome segregation ATPase